MIILSNLIFLIPALILIILFLFINFLSLYLMKKTAGNKKSITKNKKYKRFIVGLSIYGFGELFPLIICSIFIVKNFIGLLVLLGSYILGCIISGFFVVSKYFDKFEKGSN